MSGMEPGQGGVVDVDDALSQLENKLLNISAAVHTNNPFDTVLPTAPVHGNVHESESDKLREEPVKGSSLLAQGGVDS